jgi:hypothetical protein
MRFAIRMARLERQLKEVTPVEVPTCVIYMPINGRGIPNSAAEYFGVVAR